MKKTLIALAALAATGATLAQSSVTIYGRMDLGMSQQDTTVGTTKTTRSTLAGAEGERTGSRLGFRGTEDLGGGLRASFNYEIGINADRDLATHSDHRATGTNAQTRLANLSLSGGFGTVVIGTFMNAFDTVRGFSPATAGVPGGDFTQFQLGTVLAPTDGSAAMARFGSRTENAVAYVSPAMSGFTFSAGLVREDGSLADATLGAHDVSGYIIGLNYRQGPLTAQFAFGDLNADLITTGATNVDMRNWALGVTYTLQPVVLSFIYEDTRSANPGATSWHDGNAWEIGARFPMGAFAPYVTFGQGEINTRASAAGAVTHNDTSAWQIGTTYNLSARTWVYAAFGEEQRETAAGVNVRKEEGFAIGLVHTF